MQFFYDMSIRAKLLAGFILVLILTSIIVTSTVFSSLAVSQSAQNVDIILDVSYKRTKAIQAGVLELDSMVNEFIDVHNPNYRFKSVEDFINYGRPNANRLETAIKTIDPYKVGGVLPATPEFTQGMQDILRTTQEYLTFVRSTVYDLYRKQQYQQMIELYGKEGSMRLSRILDAVATVTEQQNRIARAYTAEAATLDVAILSGSLGLVVLVVGICIALFISNYINYELHVTKDLISRIGKGELTYDYTSTHKDEFGDCINKLNDARKHLLSTVQKVNKESQFVQQTVQAITKDAAGMEQNINHSESLCVSVASAATEMVSTTQEIARNCEGAANLSHTSKQITNEAVTRIRSSVLKVKEQSELAKDNAVKIEGLAEKTRDIGSIVNTIEDIASQTNLLALNAAIEAARAGEAGRGFAVVADEVRALASRTSSSTQEIGKMVQAIQNETEQSTESIKLSVENMDLVADEVTSIENIMQEITHHVNDVNTQITQIATAAEEQTSATTEISNSMTTVTHATQDVSALIREDVQKLSSISQNLTALDKELSFFKV